MRPTVFILFFVMLSVSCSSDSNSGKNYQIPRFAVYPPSNSGLPGGGNFASIFSPERNKGPEYLVLAPLNILFPPAHAQEFRCEAELEFSNNAPQTFGHGNSISGNDLIHRFYAQAIFYDCATREQALQSGVGESVQNDSENGSQETVILTASRIGDNPEDLTEYVSWTDRPESSNVRGKLVNKYLQNDGIRTKTRVDLEIDNGARTVRSMFQFVDGNDKMHMKASFKESEPDAEGNFQVQEVWGRLYDGRTDTVVQARAFTRVGSGVSIELKRCGNRNGDIESPCSEAGVETHFNADGTSVNDAGGRTYDTIEEAVNFYGGESENDYFTPKFSIE